MKCVSCGADYSVNETNCPFCHTENPEAFKRINEKKRRIDIFHAVRLETLIKAGPAIVIKVLNRILLVCICTLILLFVVPFVVMTISSQDNGKNISDKEHIQNLEAIKETGRYNQLCTYLSDNTLSRYDGVEEYWQLYFMYQDIIDYRVTWMEVENLTLEEIKSDSYIISYLLKKAHDFKEYEETTYRWSKLFDGNSKIYADYLEEIEISLMVTLGFSRQEIDDMFSSNPDESSDFDQYVQLAKERMLIDEEDKEQ